MSYAAFGAMGPWGRNAAETDEVYLWRATFAGVRIRNIQDVQAIAGAIGGSQNLGFDLRGIAIEASGPGDTYSVDAAFTTKLPRVFFADPTMDTADSIARKVHAALAERFPGFEIQGPHFDQLDDDAPKHPALDFWRFHPIIYEAQFFGSVVPTAAFARFEGLYRGNAEQGLSLKTWPKDKPFENGDGDTADTNTTIFWVAGAAAVAYLVYRVSKGARA